MTRAALYARHTNLAGAIAKGYWLPGADLDDVRQEARIALWVATGSWDPARGPFRTFAAVVIHRRLASLLRDALRAKQRVLTDASRDVEVEGGVDPWRVVVARDTLRRLRVAADELTPLERLAVGRMVTGEPLDGKADDNARMRARRKLRAAA